MIKNVYKRDGSYGLYRGFTTSYYSSAVAGFVFFGIYKGLKIKLKEIYEPKTQNQCGMIYLVSSIVAEAITLCLYYPFEIIKVRIVAKNEQYGYKSLPDAFKKMYAQGGLKGMYTGSSHFLVNYVLSYSI